MRKKTMCGTTRDCLNVTVVFKISESPYKTTGRVHHGSDGGETIMIHFYER